MYSEEFKKYLENNLNSNTWLYINTKLDELTDLFTLIKQNVANNLSTSFMNNEIDTIYEYMNYGKEIDDIIETFKELRLTDSLLDTELEENTDDNRENNNSDDVATHMSTDSTLSEDTPDEELVDTDYINNDTDEHSDTLEESDDIELFDIFITKGKYTKCPSCNGKLQDKTLVYIRYSDATKTNQVKRCQTFIKECTCCHKRYMTDSTAKAIDIKSTDINPIYLGSPTYRKCIVCGALTWNNTPYCWEHYKHEYFESK